jgi:hypothetical protein
MKKLIRLTEGDLHKIVRNAVRRVMTEAAKMPATYDSSILKGVDDIDLNSLRQILFNLVGTIRSKNTPYGAVRRLAKFLRTDGASGHYATFGGFSAKKMLARLYAENGAIKAASKTIALKDGQLSNLIMGKERINGSKTELLDTVTWYIDDIISAVNTIMLNLQNTKTYEIFRDTEVFKGSEDNRRVGFTHLILKAASNLDKIQKELNKLKQIVG